MARGRSAKLKTLPPSPKAQLIATLQSLTADFDPTNPQHRVDRRLDRAADGKVITRPSCMASRSTASRPRCWTCCSRGGRGSCGWSAPRGTGTSQSGRAIAYRLWTQRGRAVETRRGEPFYGFAEMSGGPSSDDFHAPLPESAAKSLTIPAAARSGRRASRGSRA
jgi:hypothetical protein